jgi:hypothetical protein
VTLGLAPLRPSHGASSRNVLARRRRPVRPLECAHCTSPIGQGVVGKKGESRHADSAGSTDVVPTSVKVPPLETRVEAFQLSPYHAGVAGPYRTRLQISPALHPCSCPVLLSDFSKVFASKSVALNFGHLWWQFTRCTTRRTVSKHPALQGLATSAPSVTPGVVRFVAFTAVSTILRDRRLTSHSGGTEQLIDQHHVNPLAPFAM